MLKTTEIVVRDKELLKGPWKHVSVESQASLLHPLAAPCGGVIVVGYETLSYYSRDVQHAIDPPLIKVGGRNSGGESLFDPPPTLSLPSPLPPLSLPLISPLFPTLPLSHVSSSHLSHFLPPFYQFNLCPPSLPPYPPTLQDSIISCVGCIDKSRYLLGDMNGRLLMLFIEVEEKMDREDSVVTSMRVEVLGEVRFLTLSALGEFSSFTFALLPQG